MSYRERLYNIKDELQKIEFELINQIKIDKDDKDLKSLLTMAKQADGKLFSWSNDSTIIKK